MAKNMKSIIVIEDGDEYEKFARLFLSDVCEIRAAHSSKESMALLDQKPTDAFLIDLRFDRASRDQLVGGIEETAERLFSGDLASSLTYLKDNQGTLVLSKLRENGHHQRAVFVHEFAPPVLANLKRLYGEVVAVPSFDASAIRNALGFEE